VKSPYPPGSFNAHWFQLFNAISFQIILGAPIIVYAKTLGASSTVLGIIASFTPLMTIFQLPAAKHLVRYGYRQFVLMGWGMRTVFIFIIAVVPELFFLDNASKMAVLLSILFFFNMMRGIATAAWLPWMAALIPEENRGRFISIDQFFSYGGCLLSLLFSALVMKGNVVAWEYSFVFLISALAGTMSLYFVKRIPEVHAPETMQLSSQKVPWRSMLAFPPFRELLIFNLLYMAVIGSLGVFTVEYLRDESHFDVATVLFISAFAFVGSLIVLPFSGAVIDQTGSKPLLRVATLTFSVVIAGWCLLAAGVIPCQLWIVALLNVLTGAASANFNLANVRITMATMPEMGRNHFFALFAVITSLGLGTVPVMWGMTLDAIGSYEAVTGFFHWKRHSIYFFALFILSGFAFAYIRRLHETSASAREAAGLVYPPLSQTPDA